MCKEKQCSVCKKVLPLTDFYIRRDRMKLIARCKKCNYVASRVCLARMTQEQRKEMNRRRAEWYSEQARKGNLKAILQHKINQYRACAKQKGVPYNLNVKYLIDLFNKQEGKCYYSGKIMTVATNGGRGHRTSLFLSPDQISLDRLIPKKGYVEGNVAWCTWQINTVKNSFTEDQFYSFCKIMSDRHEKRLRKETNGQRKSVF